jgi:BlaI family penicillinase repressor
MARPSKGTLTDHELSIMNILWVETSLSVAEILERFPREPKPAYTSLLTAVQAMEKKGLIRHIKDGKAYRYQSVLEQTHYKKSALSRLLDSVFHNNAYDLALNLLKEEKLDRDEIQKLKKIVEKL